MRLACIRHAASVRPEPGSNSPTMTPTGEGRVSAPWVQGPPGWRWFGGRRDHRLTRTSAVCLLRLATRHTSVGKVREQQGIKNPRGADATKAGRNILCCVDGEPSVSVLTTWIVYPIRAILSNAERWKGWEQSWVGAMSARTRRCRLTARGVYQTPGNMSNYARAFFRVLAYTIAWALRTKRITSKVVA